MNPSHPAEQNLLTRLEGIECSGTFEAHVTVEAFDDAERERFRAVCRALEVKSVLIELPQGTTRSQPMTSSYHRGRLAEVVQEVARIARTVRAEGFPVTRIKLEAVVGNTGVPETDEEARRQPAGNYFEFHVKVDLPPGADLERLLDLCQRHQAHLSSNAFRQEADGCTQRFVTQRVYGVGRARALTCFDALLADLESAGYVLSNRLREYTIYDSNIRVDAGWIEAPAGVADAGPQPGIPG
jgi:hypothetical protein